jgi:regulator of protease activity HflC (stomatin/prohibitin superfamily)
MSFVYTVPQGHCVIVERLGKANRVQRAGLSFCIPFIESVRNVGGDWGPDANKDGYLIELTEQQTDAKARQAQTKDNVTLQALDAVIYWRIVDPMRALYEVDRLIHSVKDSALNALRARVGQRTLDELLAQRDQINDEVAADLNDTMARWGVRLTRIDIQEIRYDESTAEAMRQQMDAERRARAAILKAKGEAEARVMLANAEREAAVIQAEGQARALEIRAQSDARYLAIVGANSSARDASNLLLAQKYLEGFGVITQNSGQGDKIYLPNSGAMLGLLDAAQTK